MTHRMLRSLGYAPLALAGAIALGAVASPVLAAQAGSDRQPSTAQSQNQAGGRFSDDQLKSFVKAQDNVQAAIKRYSDELSATDDADKKKKLQKKQAKTMVKAVKDAGLKPDTYNDIANAAQTDPKLTKRIQSFMTPR